ncbi:M48 family metallopeptidase [Conexibacter sp. CPCC 206217]|uniref:M48 family metallopeptidase n=1 Tax=Conexibacter sp. CPCC 206217 TaxID=3064574 RepID=UPI0027284392|nr:M48 family metallopeptidase [Conexibacter sp. CPCC 206217]MDO8211320.1 M48 family metallopeptidase [Conexibacter sp. CPCC 206217]
MTSSDAPVKGYQLKDISPRAWQHPADRAATAALASIPYLDKVVRTLIQLGYERALRQASLGASVRLGEAQLQEVWRDHQFAYSTLDMADVPSLYVTQNPIANAFAIGAKEPIVLVNSELLQLLDAPQRRAVFAHEAAHILSDHQLYRTALLILLRLTATAKIALPLIPVRTALMEWYRATELSCDRASALVTRDPLAVCRTLMSISAGAMTDQLDLDAFMAQSMEYAEKGGGLERLTRLMLDLGVTHPLPVRRTRELMLWVREGDFDRIVGGDYVRRDDPISVRAETGDAVSFYSDRFKEAFRDAGETIGQGGQQLADWLRKAKDDIGGSDDGEDDGR